MEENAGGQSRHNFDLSSSPSYKRRSLQPKAIGCQLSALQAPREGGAPEPPASAARIPADTGFFRIKTTQTNIDRPSCASLAPGIGSCHPGDPMRSDAIKKGIERAPRRAALYAVGCSEADLRVLEEAACPTCGSCAGMF